MALFFCIVISKLVDCTLEDLGLQLTYLEKASSYNVCLVNEDLHANGKINDKRHEYRQQLCKKNTLMAMEVAEKMTADNKAKVLLHLLNQNMYSLISEFTFLPRLVKLI